MRLTEDQARKITEAWAEHEETNPFARTFTSICRAMKGVNDPEQYRRGVEALLSGLPRQLADLHEIIRITGKTLDKLPGTEALSEDPLRFLAARREEE